MSDSHKGKKSNMLGKHHTKETKTKISESHKGKIISLEARKKISEANKGKPSPMLGKHHTKECKRKLSESHSGKNNHFYGKKHTLESLKKIGEASKGRYFSLESRMKMSEMRTLEKHPGWLGGKSFELYGLAFNKKLKEQIRFRDGYRCQECFKHQTELFTKTGKPKKLACHHIDYNKQNNTPSNLISLCTKCHSKTNYKRKDWTKYFQKKLKEVKEK